jgi:hypothetical protein
MAGIKRLIIDERSLYSNVAVIGTLRRQLHAHSCRPFGGLNIVICRDPAQLASVCT